MKVRWNLSLSISAVLPFVIASAHIGIFDSLPALASHLECKKVLGKNICVRVPDDPTIPQTIPGTSSNPPNPCISVNSRQGWQHFSLPGGFTKVISVGGGWSVDARNYASVSASGHNGRDAEALKPYNQYKYDPRFPFGALLMGSGQGTLWIQGAASFSNTFGAVDMRINDADNALGDNAGSLQVCFGN